LIGRLSLSFYLHPCLRLVSLFLRFFFLFFFHSSVDHLDLPSFPTRRSSDLLFLEPIKCTKRSGLGFSDIQWRDFKSSRPVLKQLDRKSTRLNSSHVSISYAVFCLKKKKQYCT